MQPIGEPLVQSSQCQKQGDPASFTRDCSQLDPSLAFSAAAINGTVYLAARGKDGSVWLDQFGIQPGQTMQLSNEVGWRTSRDFKTDAAPGLVAAGNRIYMFARSTDSRIFYNTWAQGGGGAGWKEVEGSGRILSAPAAAAVGTHLYVAGIGLDGKVILNQADAGKPFGQWFPVN